MITTEGKTHIKRYLAGYVPVIAQSVAIGVGSKAENVADTRMNFEVVRTNIVLTSYDFINNQIIYKLEVPAEFSGTIYEVGLYSVTAESVSSNVDSRLLVTFDSETEEWVDSSTGAAATYAAGNSRIGVNSLRHTPAASATKIDIMNQLALDLSSYSGNDTFVFAYNVGNANTSLLRFRFQTDASNYYEFSLGAQTAGYKVVDMLKSAATVTGTPSWSNITQVRAITTSGSGGASEVDFDGIRIENTDSINLDKVLISRKVLSTPISKDEGRIQETEFALNVTV